MWRENSLLISGRKRIKLRLLSLTDRQVRKEKLRKKKMRKSILFFFLYLCLVCSLSLKKRKKKNEKKDKWLSMKNSLIISNGISHFNKQPQSFSFFFSQRTSLKNLPAPWPTLCSTLVYRNVFLFVHILIWGIRQVLKSSWIGEAPT